MMIWRDVSGYEGLYQVSDSGVVRNKRTSAVLKVSINHGGYERVKLYKHIDGKRVAKTFLVHRLIALSFVPNEENKPQVNHIDGNKKNNCANNLEWCTQSENLAHSVRIGLRDMSCCTNVTKKKVEQWSLDGKHINTWNSMSDAARMLGLQVSNISRCCAGKIEHTGGYKWCFVT